MSFKPEVIADSSGKWCASGVRFASQRECELYAVNLAMRWTLVRDWRATECDDPVNYAWTEQGLVNVNEEVKS